MNKEMKMLTARQLKHEGFRQNEIAEVLGVTDRTVRNYLNRPPEPRKKMIRKSKLDPYKAFIETILKNDSDYNREILFDRIKNMGYTGKISILRDYAKKISDRERMQAVIRFETEPARQAQVDWKEFRIKEENRPSRKIYAFNMTLGFSRKSFVYFTESMKQSVLHLCHRKAFEYFEGVPKEILYDNMKTAFICHEGQFKPNKQLLSFANHYGFIPKRCRIRRPETKGKVERGIGYLQTNFWPRVKDSNFSCEELNEAVLGWLKGVDDKIIRDFNMSRKERFEQERFLLNSLPPLPCDCRDVFRRMVSRESVISFESNRYSVPPRLIGRMVKLLVNPLTREAEIVCDEQSIRNFVLNSPSGKEIVFYEEDRKELIKLWHKQNNPQLKSRSVKKVDIEIRHPDFYDQIINMEAVI